MVSKRKHVWTMAGVLTACAWMPVLAAEPAALCADCHGKDGASTESDVPIIGGQSAEYLKEMMVAYRDKTRPCPETKYRAGDKARPATDMCRIAKTLSDKQIDEVAGVLAGKPFVRAKQKVDLAKAQAGKNVHKLHCEKCHADGGSSKDDDSGILAGQWMPYLEHSFKEFADGSREPPKKMKPKLDELTADDKAALVQYYGSIQ